MFLLIYLLLAFLFGYYWYTIKAKLHSGEIQNNYVRFTLRFVFGLGYFFLAFLYCTLVKKKDLFQILTQVYFLFELVVLITGFTRKFIIDNTLIISFYSTLLGITVSPLGLILSHVILSINKNKSIWNVQ